MHYRGCLGVDSSVLVASCFGGRGDRFKGLCCLVQFAEAEGYKRRETCGATVAKWTAR